MAKNKFISEIRRLHALIREAKEIKFIIECHPLSYTEISGTKVLVRLENEIDALKKASRWFHLYIMFRLYKFKCIK